MRLGFQRDGGIHTRAWDIFERTGLKADESGWVETSILRVRLDADPYRLALLHGDESTPVTYDEIETIGLWLVPFDTFEDGGLRSVLFADGDRTAVYWSGVRSACVFESLSPEHRRVLRALAATGMPADERRDAEISGRETVLQLSALYSCRGVHARECPRPGPWPRSLVRPDGSVVTTKVALL